jgi:hypothetical protein
MKKTKNITRLFGFAASFVVLGCILVAGGISARLTSLHIQSRFQSGNYSIQRVMIKAGIFSENQLETERERILFKGLQGAHKVCVSLSNLLVSIADCFIIMGVALLFLGASCARFVFSLKKQVGDQILNGLPVAYLPVNPIPQPPATPKYADRAAAAQ